MTPENVETQC